MPTATMPDTRTTPTAEPQSLERSFYQLSVSRRMWRGEHVLPDAIAKLKVQDQDVEANRRSKNRICLLPDAWLKKFQVAMLGVNQALNRTTIPMRLTNEDTDSDTDTEDDPQASRVRTRSLLVLRIMPHRARRQVFEAIRGVNNDLQRVVHDLQAVYDEDVIEWNRNYWAPLFQDTQLLRQHVLSRIPRAEDLPRRFRVDVGIFRVSAGQIEQISDREYDAEMRAAAANAQRQIDNAMAEIIREPRRVLVEAIASLGQQLTTGKKLSTASFNDLRAAAELVRSFSDAAEDALLSRIQTMSKVVEDAVASADGRVGSTTFAAALQPHISTLTAAMRAVRQQCENNEAVQKVFDRFGGQGRALEL